MAQKTEFLRDRLTIPPFWCRIVCRSNSIRLIENRSLTTSVENSQRRKPAESATVHGDQAHDKNTCLNRFQSTLFDNSSHRIARLTNVSPGTATRMQVTRKDHRWGNQRQLVDNQIGPLTINLKKPLSQRSGCPQQYNEQGKDKSMAPQFVQTRGLPCAARLPGQFRSG